MASYLTSKLTEKQSSAGELGVIETKPYKISQIEDKSETETTIQVRGREAIKEKYLKITSIMKELKLKDIKAVFKKLEFEKDIFEPNLSQVSGGNLLLREFIYISPTFQNKRFGVAQEEACLRDLIDNLGKKKAELDSVYMASAYFNPPYAIWDALSLLNSDKFEFITATKEVKIFHQANSFYGAKFPKNDIAPFYERLWYSFKNRFAKENMKKTSFKRYYRPGWTFHTKRNEI